MSDAPLSGKQILVGVGGSIAAYRACDVVRELRALGAAVRVAPTAAAQKFVTALTFEALSGQPVLSGVLELDHGKIPHIEEAYGSDAVVVVAATADLLAQLSHGLASEALTATLLSFRGPLLLAPAMETRMWQHPATQHNIATLVARGAQQVGPVAGPLASGRAGVGRMADVSTIVEATCAALAKKDFAGRRVVVTAGPTVEDVDPVRFLTNRSSGKMGVALAQMAARRGATVELVHGPLRVPVPQTPGLHAHPVRSAADMHARVMALLAEGAVDAALLCAAVADATPAAPAAQKIKKDQGGLTQLNLVETKDILAEVSRAGPRRPRAVVGFAAETTDVVEHARQKLKKKGCDLICANDVTQGDAGFDTDTNRLLLVRASTVDPLPLLSKAAAADRILDVTAGLLGMGTAFESDDARRSGEP